MNTYEPEIITAGDAVSWSRADLLAQFPGATLGYVFFGGGTPVTATADAAFGVSLNGATTGAMAAGRWQWTATVTVGGDRQTVATGTLTIAPNPASISSNVDVRSHAERTLAAIEATIEGRATEAHSIVKLQDGREVASLSLKSLIEARDYYVRIVAQERQAERVARGFGRGNTLTVSFT